MRLDTSSTGNTSLDKAAKHSTSLYVFVSSADHSIDEWQNPFDGKVVATVPTASEQDVSSAVAAAAKAQPAWAALAASKRARVLRKFSDLMAENASKLAEVRRLLFVRSLL